MEDEKKPFDNLQEAASRDEMIPDPDEELMLDQGSGKAWLVKVPKTLLQRWAAVDQDDVHLATVRIYNPDPNDPHGKPRIVLFLPPNRDPVNAPATPPTREVGPSLAHPNITNWPLFEVGNAIPTTGAEPDVYELDMVNDNVENQIIVAERPKDMYAPQHASRVRTTILTGRIKHECSLRPSLSRVYRKQVHQRHQMYNTHTRQIKRIEEAGDRGYINRISSGVGVGAGAGFRDLVKTKAKAAKGNFERMARMPRNQLLDELFAAFRSQPRWAIKPLREKTQQPEAYLKEVLSEIAFLNRSGEHNGLWELKANYRDNPQTAKSENVPGPSGDFKMEEEEDFDDDDDDDEEMEEIS